MHVMLFAQALACFGGTIRIQLRRGHDSGSASQNLLQQAIYGEYSSMAALGGASGTGTPRLHERGMHMVCSLWIETIQRSIDLTDVELW